MQRTKLKNGQEVAVKVGRYNAYDGVIVNVDRAFAHEAHRRNGGRMYSFIGVWDQAIAVAYKDDSGTWRPRVITTRYVLGPLEEVRAKEAEAAIARRKESELRMERAAEAAARREARLEAHPAVVAELNEFLGTEAFHVSYDGRIRTSPDRVVKALSEALGLEVLA